MAMRSSPVAPDLLTVDDVSFALKLRKARVYELVRAGAIPGVVRIGRQIRLDRSSLEGFVRSGGTPHDGLVAGGVNALTKRLK